MANRTHIDRTKKAKNKTLDLQSKTLIQVPCDVSKNLFSICANSNILAVGEDGTIVEYNSSLDKFEAHSQSGSITTNTLRWIDTSLGDGATVGDKFTVLTYAKSTDTFSAHPANGYDTNVNLYRGIYPNLIYGVLYDIFVGVDNSNSHGVIYTYDGATVKKVLDTGTASGAIRAFATLDYYNYVAVGESGKIYKSLDSGATWSEVDSGITDDLFDIGGMSYNELFIVSKSGKIYKFNFYTEELTLIEDFGIPLVELYMVDVGNAYVVGSSGTLIHYDGEDWISIPTGAPVGFTGIMILSDNSIYISAAYGYIYRFYSKAYPSVLIDNQGKVTGTPLNPIHNKIQNVDELAEAIGVGLVGTATGGSATTLEDTNEDWETDMWKGDLVAITDGTGKGQVRTISSNTSNTLTVANSWSTIPDTTSDYTILTLATVEATTELTKVSGVSLTGRDWSSDFSNLPNLDTPISTVDTDLKSQLERRVYGSDYATTPTYSPIKVGTDGLAHLRVAADDVGLATETTLSSIKTQTDKLTFDANNYIKSSNRPRLEVLDETISDTEKFFVSSGIEVSWNNLTVDGIIRNRGYVEIFGIYDGKGIYDGLGVYS